MRPLALRKSLNGSLSLRILSLAWLSACGKLPDYQVVNATFGFTASGELNPDVDILFVVDNSGSMSGNQTILSDSMADFIDSFSSKNLEFHIGVISTDQYCNSSVHSPMPTNTECNNYWDRNNYSGFYNNKSSTLLSQYSGEAFLTWLSPSYVTKFQDNVLLGTSGSGYEMPILSATNALSDPNLTGWNNGFIRDGSFLSVIMVSDEDETAVVNNTSKIYNSGNLTPINNRVDGFVSAVAALDRPNLERFRVDVIARRPSDGSCSAEVANGLNHMVSRINANYPATSPDPDKARISTICSNFSAALSDIGDAIVQLVAKIELDQLPANENDMMVRVNGSVVTRSTTNGWEYYSTGNYIQFFGTAIPSAGDQILVDYTPANPI